MGIGKLGQAPLSTEGVALTSNLQSLAKKAFMPGRSDR